MKQLSDKAVALSIRQVYKAYGDQQALKGVDLEVARGTCMVLLGPSGSGKSTLLKTVNRLIDIDLGEIYLEGTPITQYEATALRRQMGYGIQGVGLFPHYTVAQNIAVVPNLLKWPKEKIHQRLQDLLELAGLPQYFSSKYPRELSGGEAQRVGVLRALAADPPLLLMDEPFGAVDPLTREKLQQGFVAIQRQLKKTVIFVTHDVEEAIMLGDQIAIMRDGKIEACETPRGHLKAGSSEFVRSFLGADYVLNLLSRYTLEDFMAWRYGNEIRAYPPQLRSEAQVTLKTVLADLIAGIRWHQWLSLEDLHRFSLEVVQ